MRKIFESIGRVTTRISAVILGIYLAAILPIWLGGIIVFCGFICLVISEMEG